MVENLMMLNLADTTNLLRSTGKQQKRDMIEDNTRRKRSITGIRGTRNTYKSTKRNCKRGRPIRLPRARIGREERKDPLRLQSRDSIEEPRQERV